MCLKYDSCDITVTIEPVLWLVMAWSLFVTRTSAPPWWCGLSMPRRQWHTPSWACGWDLDNTACRSYGEEIWMTRVSKETVYKALGHRHRDCICSRVESGLHWSTNYWKSTENCTFCLVPFLRWLGHVYSWSNFISGSFLTTNYHNVLCCSPSYQVEQRGVRVSPSKLFFLEIFCCINSTGLPFRAVTNNLICHEEAS